MSKSQAKKIVREYARILRAADYPFHAIYLFGSQVMGKAKAWSDIDVAVVSDKLKRNEDKNRFLLWRIRREVDTRIEPHGFTAEDFRDNSDPLVYEIKKTGVRIA